MLPKGWEIASGEEITTKITKGQSPKWQGFDYQSSGTLFVTSENVRDGKIDISTPKYLPLEFNVKLKGSQLKKGDILINIVGASIGRSCLFNLEVEHANINQAVCLFRPNDKVSSHFVAQFLQLPNTKNKLLGAQSESARPNLSLGDMRRFQFLIPPLLEQKKIAQILSIWDKTITITEQLLANSQQQKKALMQQLLTGKKRFPGFSGEWRVIPISKMGQVVSGGTPDTKTPGYWDGPIKWLTPTDVTSLRTKFVYETARSISENGVKSSSAKLLPQGALLVCTRATIGEMAISTSEITTNQGFKNLIPNKNFSVEFLYYLFAYNVHEFIRKASGSTFLELSKGDFEKIGFFCPEIREQQKIVSVLSAADREIEVLKQKIEFLIHEKKSLMQQLLTGKRRVKLEAA